LAGCVVDAAVVGGAVAVVLGAVVAVVGDVPVAVVVVCAAPGSAASATITTSAEKPTARRPRRGVAENLPSRSSPGRRTGPDSAESSRCVTTIDKGL
ncbi:MAG: hypothetical protein WBM50_02540, partial [Acidimicrobiales bacterium]